MVVMTCHGKTQLHTPPDDSSCGKWEHEHAKLTMHKDCALFRLGTPAPNVTVTQALLLLLLLLLLCRGTAANNLLLPG
jgi:hypothetical protein